MTTPAGEGPAAPGEVRRSRRGRRWWIAGLAIAVLVVVVLAPLASGDPDGLERVAGDLGFAGRAEDSPLRLLADYALPFVDDPAVSTALAGLIGLVVVVALSWLVGRLLARRRS